jgi:hypothetical protein
MTTMTTHLALQGPLAVLGIPQQVIVLDEVDGSIGAIPACKQTHGPSCHMSLGLVRLPEPCRCCCTVGSPGLPLLPERGVFRGLWLS